MESPYWPRMLPRRQAKVVSIRAQGRALAATLLAQTALVGCLGGGGGGGGAGTPAVGSGGSDVFAIDGSGASEGGATALDVAQDGSTGPDADNGSATDITSTPDVTAVDVPEIAAPEADIATCTPAACDDFNPCTADLCDKAGACANTPKVGPCDDGKVCTVGDSCVQGNCQGAVDAAACDDGDPCTVDSCAGGDCAFKPKCPSPLVCQPNGTCMTKICTPGSTTCDGTALATCNSSGSAWVTTPCPTTPCALIAGKAACSASSDTCCQAKGASCGYVPGCPKSCGGCPTGKKCDVIPGSPTLYSCISNTPNLKANGQACGPDSKCLVPANNASAADQQSYYDCVNSQCAGGRCLYGVCTQDCKMTKDVKSTTGQLLPGGDGIEDADAVGSDCTGFADGPAGSSFKCVEVSEVGALGTFVCTPGGSFASCKANSDCAAGQVCGARYVRGINKAVCIYAHKEPNGSPGKGVGEFCNANPKVGTVATCKSSVCGGIGCIEFCQSDADCLTAGALCQAGTCATSGSPCTSDTDCSVWSCKKGQATFGSDQPKVDVCMPKTCYLDEDCKNNQFYCLSTYNGVKNQGGDPDPDNPGKVIVPGWGSSLCVKKAPNTAKKGEPCDEYPGDDDVTLKMCENKYWCNNGTCSGHCLTDANCPAGSLCGVVEIPLDMSTPPDGKYDVYTAVQVCTPMPKATAVCSGQKQCAGQGASNYCRPIQVAAAPNPGGNAYTLIGKCIAPELGLGSTGAACGNAVGKGCKSGICLGAQTTGVGYCADLCAAKADCPATAVYSGFGTDAYKLVCRSLLWANNLTAQPHDDLYVPVCLPNVANSSLADCSATFKCSLPEEACSAHIVALGPDKPATIEYLCASVKNANGSVPNKPVGASCDPNADANAPEECASGICMPDSASYKGYCSAFCQSDADCGGGLDTLFCDTKHQILPRKDPAMAAVAPLCMKKKSCIPCMHDYQCATGTLCTWAEPQAASGRCAQPCQGDANCLGTDGGSKCVQQIDAYGKSTAAKVCAKLGCP